MDFCFILYLKSKLYETNVMTISALKENIVREVNAIQTSLIQGVPRNTEARFQECVRREELYLDEIIFKK